MNVEQDRVTNLPSSDTHLWLDTEPTWQEFNRLFQANTDARSVEWDAPVQTLRPVLIGTAAAILGRESFRCVDRNPEDVAQDFFTRCLGKALRNYEPGRLLCAYLYDIFVNECITKFRRARLRQTRPLTIDAKHGRLNPLHSIERKQVGLDVRLAIDKLNPDERRVVSDRCDRGMSAGESGEKEDCKPSKIYRRRSAAYQKLREFLAVYDPDQRE